MPDIQINMTTILMAVVANFFFGFFWFSVLFKKAWSKEMGFDLNKAPPKKELFKSLGLALIGYFLLAFVLFHQIAVYNPETWGVGNVQLSDTERVIEVVLCVWLGFFIPLLLNSVAWAKHSWKLFAINASYHLLALALVAKILIYLD